MQASFGCDHFSSRAISLAFLALGGTLADAAHQQLPGVENRVAKLYRRDSNRRRPHKPNQTQIPCATTLGNATVYRWLKPILKRATTSMPTKGSQPKVTLSQAQTRITLLTPNPFLLTPNGWNNTRFLLWPVHITSVVQLTSTARAFPSL